MHTKTGLNPNLYPVVGGWVFLEIFRAEACLKLLRL